MGELKNIFDLLDELSELPYYQLERRADIFFARHLPTIMNAIFIGEEIGYDDIIPEFPVKQDDSNRSNPIDYSVWGKDTLYLIELKTSMSSIKPGQMKFLIETSEKSLCELIGGVLTIGAASTTYKKKYEHLITRLKKALSSRCDIEIPGETLTDMKNKFLARCGITSKTWADMRTQFDELREEGKLEDIPRKIVCIWPRFEKKGWMEETPPTSESEIPKKIVFMEKEIEIIFFDDVIKCIDKEIHDEIQDKRFRDSLDKWKVR